MTTIPKMNLKNILSGLPTFGQKHCKSFIKPDKVQEKPKKAYPLRKEMTIDKLKLIMEQSRQKPIRKMSAKQVDRMKEYQRARKSFFKKKENRRCAVFPELKAEEVHHIRGRVGSFLCDKRYFLGVSRKGHHWIHNNVEEAQKKGWIQTRVEN